MPVRIPLEDHLDGAERALRRVLDMGAEFADVRLQEHRYQLVAYDNDRVRQASYSTSRGAGFRVVYRGVHGYSSTTSLDPESLAAAAERALKLARGLHAAGAKPRPLAEAPVIAARAVSPFLRDPFSVDPGEYVEKARQAVEAARSVEGVVSAVAMVAAQWDDRLVVNSEGTRTAVRTVSTGIAVRAYAKGRAGLESVSDYSGRVQGWEHIARLDAGELGMSVGRLARQASDASVPEAGIYRVVLEPGVVGVLIHEALGHASEADLVSSGESVLQGRIGETVAAETVSVVDDGRAPGGYYVPFDDEGVEKARVKVIENGVLRSFLTGRAEARELGLPLTGNARVQGYAHPLLVRQTNYYILPGDASVEELIEQARDGIYVTSKGGGGGQVEPGTGTFTFNVGVSYRIRNGRLAEPLRGVNIAGQILETLRRVEGLGKRLEVRTGAVFGGCGKGGQLVRVGDGGPHVLVSEMRVGGK